MDDFPFASDIIGDMPIMIEDTGHLRTDMGMHDLMPGGGGGIDDAQQVRHNWMLQPGGGLMQHKLNANGSDAVFDDDAPFKTFMINGIDASMHPGEAHSRHALRQGHDQSPPMNAPIPNHGSAFQHGAASKAGPQILPGHVTGPPPDISAGMAPSEILSTIDTQWMNGSTTKKRKSSSATLALHAIGGGSAGHQASAAAAAAGSFPFTPPHYAVPFAQTSPPQVFQHHPQHQQLQQQYQHQQARMYHANAFMPSMSPHQLPYAYHGPVKAFLPPATVIQNNLVSPPALKVPIQSNSSSSGKLPSPRGANASATANSTKLHEQAAAGMHPAFAHLCAAESDTAPLILPFLFKNDNSTIPLPYSTVSTGGGTSMMYAAPAGPASAGASSLAAGTTANGSPMALGSSRKLYTAAQVAATKAAFLSEAAALLAPETLPNLTITEFKNFLKKYAVTYGGNKDALLARIRRITDFLKEEAAGKTTSESICS